MKRSFYVPAMFTLLLSASFLLLRHPLAAAEVLHREPLVQMDFIGVRGGSYVMGDFTGEGTAKERPAHEEAVQDYYLGRHEVTVGQFRAFTEGTGYVTEAERKGGVVDIDFSMNTLVRRKDISWKNAGFPQGDRDPVVWVTWNDAAAFTSWLAGATGRPYRLPTEAEWEYAAREGGKSLRWSGTTEPGAVTGYAWFSENSGGSPRPVGGKKANAFGFHDLSGNVWEWCSDWLKTYRAVEVSPVDGLESPQGEFRSLRGGSWRVEKDVIRTTYRNGYRPDYAHSSIGFRVALSWEGGNTR